MLAVDYHRTAVDHDIRHVGCGRCEHDVLDGRAATVGADRIRLYGDEVGACADRKLAGVGPAEGAVPVVGRGPQQPVGGDGAAGTGGEAFVQLDRTGLLEQVDHGVA